jgi:two-component system, NarL family, sensor histidine kinase EvgS
LASLVLRRVGFRAGWGPARGWAWGWAWAPRAACEPGVQASDPIDPRRAAPRPGVPASGVSVGALQRGFGVLGRRLRGVAARGLLAALALPGAALAGTASTPVTPEVEAAAAAAPAVVPAGPVLRYGVLAGFPPYQVWPEGAPPGGVDIALLRDLAAAAGVALELVRYAEYGPLEDDLRAGRVDIASSMARTPERERWLQFSAPYTRVSLGLLTRTDQPSGALSPDLAGRSIAVVSGFASERQVDRLFPLASRVPVDSVREGLEAVLSGRADTFIESEPVLVELMLRERIVGLSVVRRFEAASGQLHLAWPLQAGAAADLAAQLAAGLADLPSDRVATLLRDWSVRPTAVSGVLPFRLEPADVTLLQGWRSSAGAPVIGLVGSEPPFASFDERGQPQGLTVDMLRAVLERLGVPVGPMQPLSPAQARQAVIDGSVDLLVGMDESADLVPLLRFVGPFIEYPMVLIGRPESALFELDQLVGRRLALPPRSAARALVESRYPGIDIVDCADVVACIDAVGLQRADGTLADVVAAVSTLARRPRVDVQVTGVEPALRRAHSLAVHVRHAELVPLVKRALDHAVETDMEALKQRWFTRPMRQDVVRALAWRYGPWGLALLGLLALLVVLHARRLRAEIDRTRVAQHQAERADRASRRLLTFLAHEVRNSLHAVISGAELAASAVGQAPGRAAVAGVSAGATAPAAASGATPWAGMLAGSARATLHLLNNLIDRDRLDSGQLVLRLEPVRLSVLADAVVREMTPAAVHCGSRLQLRHEGADPVLALDTLRLQQIVRNLVANALKYARSGLVEVRLAVQPAPQGEGHWLVDLEVCDPGPVASDDRLRVASVDAAGGEPAPGSGRAGSGFADFSAPASGLGLPLCRDLAKLMAGEFHLGRLPDGGTQARLRFAARSAAGVARPERVQAPAPVMPAAAGIAPQGMTTSPPPDGVAPRRVLVVEDAEAYGLMLVRGFEQLGHQAQLVPGVQAAREALAAQPFDLVLTDFNLPDGDAREVLAAMAQQPLSAALATTAQHADAGGELRAVVMTADIDDGVARLGGLPGVAGVLAKSDDVRLLVARALALVRETV